MDKAPSSLKEDHPIESVKESSNKSQTDELTRLKSITSQYIAKLQHEQAVSVSTPTIDRMKSFNEVFSPN